MGIKSYNPYTPSRRHMTGSDFSEITKKTPEKSLLASKRKNAGRNNQGKITVRHQGGGNRQKYRIIDFKRNDKDGIPATVVGIEYDPNRTANIALISSPLRGKISQSAGPPSRSVVYCFISAFGITSKRSNIARFSLSHSFGTHSPSY